VTVINRVGAGLPGVVSRHPLVSFFVLANALSWIAWTPYVLSRNGLGVCHFAFPNIFGTSQILGMLPGAYLGPITSALIVTAIAGGSVGLRQWGARLWKWRVRWYWYAIALVGVPAALVLTGAVASGGQVVAPSLTAVALYVPLLFFQMITTGLAEEPGWRDFALPRLQAKFGPMRSAFILGPLWALWHMPLFFTEWGGWPNADWTRPVAFTVFCIGFNVVMAWIFNSTGQSLPLAMLAHVSVNNFASVIWGEMFPSVDENFVMPTMAVGAVTAAVFVIGLTRGRLGYRPELGRVGKVDEPILVGPDDRLQS
jgi:membrane protease YdiL (CAAX protease family)